MIQTISLLTPFYEKVVLLKSNNIEFFLLNYKQNYISLSKNLKKFKNFFVHSYIIYFLKIVWRGKAFRIRFFKKSNKFTLNFGHSHWLKLLFMPNIFNFFKIRRQGYLVHFKNRFDFNIITSCFNNLREMNKYTKRGIRIKTTPYIKRFGKISQVNSSLHSFG